MLDIAECEPSGSETNDSARESETYENKTWNDVVGEMTKEGEEGEEGGENLSATTTNASSRPRRVVVGHSMGGVAAAIAPPRGTSTTSSWSRPR